ncbi:helicase-associated domain-containing protein [Streptomyces xinghaiensis]|uniref:helicase-associated domain-containing protein n=1 Tax=Streptomyces xinghaiensis TaxID=1038928 RepID=UPI003433EBA2
MTTERNGEARVPAETGPAGRAGAAGGSTGTGAGAGGGPRTLAEELRSRGDGELAELLRARPDLLSPVPGDLTQLATRAVNRASVARALEQLDRFAVQTAEALAVAPDPCAYDTLLTLMAGEDREETVTAELPRAVTTLRTRALLWGGSGRLHLVRTARELLAPATTGPAAPSTGLGPTVSEATAGMSPGRLQQILATAGLPTTHDSVTAVEALTALFTDRERMAGLLGEAPPEALRVLDRLVWGPPYGQVPADPGPAVRWLVARGLLLPTAPGTVVLPREVALHLRGGRAHRIPEPLPPPVESAAQYSPRSVDSAGAGQAFTAIGTVDDLLHAWETAGPAVLRAGGVSIRDLKRTAAALDTDEATAVFWIELAYAAGLLASDGTTDERFVPTPAYDEWRARPAQERWAALVAAWLPATRTAGVVGGHDAKGRALTVLGPGLDRSQAPEMRHRTLELLATLAPGAAPRPESVLARLRWERGVASEARGGAGTGTVTGGFAPGTGTGTGAGAGAGYGGGTGPGYGDGSRDRAAHGAPSGRAATAGARRGGAPDGWRTAGTAPVSARGLSSAEELRTRLTEWTLREAELLGVTGRGALSAHGRVLLGLPAATDATGGGDGTDTGGGGGAGPGTAAPGPAASGAAPGSPALSAGSHPAGPRPAGAFAPRSASGIAAAAARAAEVLAPLLPEPLDHVLLQADLTAVAPGPLERPLAETLDVLAEIESKGGATVYRFTPDSVRRALDSGRTAEDLHAFLAEHSRTPVPQPLSYLIDDVARRHGHLRVGAASAYVRCEDDGLLAEILADKRSEGLRLRRLAPTVLAAELDPATLLTKLREMGYAPAAESAEGDVLITRPGVHRTPPRTPPAPVAEGLPVPDDTLLTATVRAVRAGDRAASGAPGPAGGAGAPPRAPGGLPRSTPGDTLAALQAAALTGSPVWIGCITAEGAADRRLIAPVRVESGVVTAYDHTAEEVRTYPLHRITGVAEPSGGEI